MKSDIYIMTAEGKKKKVKAELAFNMFLHSFYIHHSIDKKYSPKWSVTEFKTGRLIEGGDTKKKAIENAKLKLEKKGYEEFLKAVEKAEKINHA